MAPEKAPAFQFYPKDFLTDSKVVAMNLTELGAYVVLLCRCWLDGQLPQEMDALARLCHVSTSAFTRLWPALQPCFVLNDGRLVQPRIEREREKQQQYRETKAAAGRQGGRPKAQVKQIESITIANESSSSAICYLQSSDSSQRTARAKSLDVIPDEDPQLRRAGKLLERYAELFHEHRRGARYHNRMHLDFPKACELVKTWPDDARLEKLAVIVLTTDDDWISRTDRGFGIFAARASWADDRLTTWESEQKVGA